jgi:GNAT superfamily N-acetyltransferase
MPASELTIETDPAPELIQYLEDRLYEFNAGITRITDGAGLAIFVRDDSGQVVAGICGNTWGGCCEIRQFWVAESQRGRGQGTKLLAAAEREARGRGCQRMFLMTFTFQAPAFYQKRGYRTVAAIDDYPRGYQNLLLSKPLGASG